MLYTLIVSIQLLLSACLPNQFTPTNSSLINFQSNACADHHVHQCLEQLAEDFLRQDDRRLAYFQSPTSLH